MRAACGPHEVTIGAKSFDLSGGLNRSSHRRLLARGAAMARRGLLSIPAELHDDVYCLVLAGVGMRVVGEALGVSRMSICRLMRQYGAVLPQGRRPSIYPTDSCADLPLEVDMHELRRQA